VMASFEQLKKLPEFKPGDGSRSARAEERDRVGRANLARLVAAGVPVAAGTDAGNIGTLHGPSLFRELRAMQEAGLTTAQVLTAATLGGARVMGRERELGSVEAGKRADLLLLEADPLADLGALEKAHSVVKDGRIYAPEELRRAAEGGDRR